MNARIKKLEAQHEAADRRAEAARVRGDLEGYQAFAVQASRIADRIELAHEELEWSPADHRAANAVVRHWPEHDDSYNRRRHAAVKRSRAQRAQARADAAKRRATRLGTFGPPAGEAA